MAALPLVPISLRAPWRHPSNTAAVHGLVGLHNLFGLHRLFCLHCLQSALVVICICSHSFCYEIVKKIKIDEKIALGLYLAEGTIFQRVALRRLLRRKIIPKKMQKFLIWIWNERKKAYLCNPVRETNDS